MLHIYVGTLSRPLVTMISLPFKMRLTTSLAIVFFATGNFVLGASAQNSLRGNAQGVFDTGISISEVSARSWNTDFNADGLASGTYLVRMEAGDFVQTRQITLLK